MSKKNLIVDDDPTSLKMTQSTLMSHGYAVKAIAHAQDIEKTVKDFNPQAIVMDLLMPQVDGSQAVQRLQKNPALNKIPVIFLTALQMKDEKRGLEFELNVENKSFRTLTKPLDARALIAEIEELVK